MTTWQDRMTPRPPRAPPLDLVRTLWTATRAPNKTITAGIYVVETGRELRVSYGDPAHLIDSLLSRRDDAPLEARARELRAVLEQQGWTVVS